MTERPSDDPSLDEFLTSTSRDDSSVDVGKIGDEEVGTPNVMDKLNRRRRRYDWAVSVPLFLIGGYFAMRFLVGAVFSARPNAELYNLCIALFVLVIAFLVHVKYKQRESEG